ncbi:MAG: 2-oxo acid dehydrogenase subunit E2 [Clostridiaceae bacterium]|nr:2-oxo acid dehydrogenase subunit E2 [Clostridiaceae bacterium]
MAKPVVMPRQGQSVESCIIGKWHKEVGDPVAEGEILFTYETDKAVFDEPAPVAGTLLARFYEEGDDVPCLRNVCVIGAPGEDVSAFASEAASDTAAAPDPASAAPAEAPSSAQKTVQPEPKPQELSGQPQAASPRARSLANRLGMDSLRAIQGRGPEGRILERDVRAAHKDGQIPTPAAARMLENEGRVAVDRSGIGGRVRAADVGEATASGAMAGVAPSIGAVEDRAYTRIRRSIGTAMMASLTGSAQLTLNASFDAEAMLALRARMKAVKEKEKVGSEGTREGIPSVNDWILFAVSRVLSRHPLLNAHGFEDRIRVFESVHLGVAVDTPRGLMVPTVFHADRLGLAGISAQVRALAAQCRSGAIPPDLLQGGTFTVTNLGMFGIESFTPVINPPQTAILGVCAPQTRMRPAVEGCMPLSYTAIPLSLTFDHRAMDGADAARFLQELVNYLNDITANILLDQADTTS